MYYANSPQLEYMPRPLAEMLDTRSEGHKGDHARVLCVRVRIRIDVCRSRSSVRADGGTVAGMVDLVSCFSGLPDQVPGSSKSVRAMGYSRTLRAIMDLKAKSGRNCNTCTRLLLPIGRAITLAAREGISDREIQREG